MENTKFTTVGGHTIEARAFITGRQARHIKDAYLEDTKFTQEDGKNNFGISGAKFNIAQDRAIEAVIVSVDGVTENVLNAVLELPSADFDQVIKHIDEVTSEKKNEVSTKTT